MRSLLNQLWNQCNSDDNNLGEPGDGLSAVVQSLDEKIQVEPGGAHFCLNWLVVPMSSKVNTPLLLELAQREELSQGKH